MDRKKRNIILFAGICTIALVAMYVMVNNGIFYGQKEIDTYFNNEVHNPYKDAHLEVVVISAPNDTYGYSIDMNGSTLIHQPSAPALPGVEGFDREEDARIVGEFVIDKIRNNIFPPSVTVEELDSLGVI